MSIIGISNTLDFKEKLDPRVVSSLNVEEIIFEPYQQHQIQGILKDRVKDAFAEGIVEESAINLCSAMASQENGDARRAIDLLRVAGEIAERAGSEKISDEHVRIASSKMEEDKDTTTLNSLPLHQKLLVLAVARSNGSSISEIYQGYRNLCKSLRKQELTLRRTTQMLSELDETHTLIAGKIIYQGIHGRSKKYNTTVPIEIIKKAFQDEFTLQDIL